MKQTLRYVAIAGNALFILWIIFNAIDSGFSGTVPEKISFAALLIVLALNIYFLTPKTRA